MADFAWGKILVHKWLGFWIYFTVVIDLYWYLIFLYMVISGCVFSSISVACHPCYLVSSTKPGKRFVLLEQRTWTKWRNKTSLRPQWRSTASWGMIPGHRRRRRETHRLSHKEETTIFWVHFHKSMINISKNQHQFSLRKVVLNVDVAIVGFWLSRQVWMSDLRILTQRRIISC